jgi:hypothetical protein
MTMQSYFFASVAPDLIGGSEGEGVRKLKFFSYIRTPSPQPSPLWGEGVRMRKPPVTQEHKSHG